MSFSVVVANSHRATILMTPIEIEYLEGESDEDFLSRRERLFQEDLIGKGYEMLGRIWYIFRDAFYAPSEVRKLLEECLDVQLKAESNEALSALEKLIYACNEALRVNSGVLLICD